MFVKHQSEVIYVVVDRTQFAFVVCLSTSSVSTWILRLSSYLLGAQPHMSSLHIECKVKLAHQSGIRLMQFVDARSTRQKTIFMRFASHPHVLCPCLVGNCSNLFTHRAERISNLCIGEASHALNIDIRSRFPRIITSSCWIKLTFMAKIWKGI